MAMLRAVRLTVMPEAAEIVAGSVLSLSLTVQNVGGRTDRYLLEIAGVPDAWFTLANPIIVLQPGARERIDLYVCPPADIEQDLIGSYSITTWVTAKDAPSVQAVAVVALTVVDRGLSLDVSPAEAEGSAATFYVTYFNQLRWPTAIELALGAKEAGLRYHVKPVQPVLVPAGGYHMVAVHVQPKGRAMIGAPRPYEIEFHGLILTSSYPEMEAEVQLPCLRRQARFIYRPHYVF